MRLPKVCSSAKILGGNIFLGIPLAGFEDVIARATEKHETATLEIRQQIYSSARTALAGMLAKSGNLSQENIDQQQQKLETAIIKTEARYDMVAEEEHIEAAPEYYAETEEPYYELPGEYVSQYPAKAESRLHPFAMFLFVTIIIAAVGIAVWLIYDQQLATPPSSRDNSVPNPPRILAGEDSPDAGSTDQQSDPIVVFRPDDPTGLIADGAIVATLAKDSDGTFVRLSGESAEPDNFVSIVIDPGVMETMAGKKAVFDLKIKSGEGTSSTGNGHQFVLTCQFRELGSCGRKRFTANSFSESFVFETDLGEGPVSGKEKDGLLMIAIDVSGTGRALDIYSVRVTIDE